MQPVVKITRLNDLVLKGLANKQKSIGMVEFERTMAPTEIIEINSDEEGDTKPTFAELLCC